jgi:UrcA family protein
MLPLIAAVAAIGCAAGSHAAPASRQAYGSEAVSVRVRLADLDLANPAGAEAGLRRIHNAAREICGPDSDFEFSEVRRIHEACMLDVVDRAVARLGNPTVSAMASNGH